MPTREPVPLPEFPISTRPMTTDPGVSEPSLSASMLEPFLDAVIRELGPTRVHTDNTTRRTFSRDWWPRLAMWATHSTLPTQPGAVVQPPDAAGVAAVIRLANEHLVPLTPAAGRSGVCGGAVPVGSGVALDLSSLDQVLDIDDHSLRVRTQAGVFGIDLEDQLRQSGHTLGHWPQSIEISTVGGWLACRSAGQYSTRYGKIEDMVASIKAVTGAGAHLAVGGAPRAATGPDLTQLMVGSEGALAVITEATLRIHPAPVAEERTAFGFSRFHDGLDVCRRVLRRGAHPAVIRLYDAVESRRSYDQETNVLLVLDEGDPELVAATMRIIREECTRTPEATPLDNDLVGQWLEHRNDTSPLGRAVQTGLVVDTIEVAGTWTMLPRLFDDVRHALTSVEGNLAATAHCSHSYLDGGCLYFTFAGHVGHQLETKDRFYRDSFTAAMVATTAAGAAISHHHGIGHVRAPYLRRALGEGAFRLLEDIKHQLDPNGILNPGVLGLNPQLPPKRP